MAGEIAFCCVLAETFMKLIFLGVEFFFICIQRGV